ncbi:MAG: FHA domain-containing protein [archaeon]
MRAILIEVPRGIEHDLTELAMLHENEIKVGRNSSSHIKLPECFGNISRSHASLIFLNDNFMFVDNSTNGSYIIRERSIVPIHMYVKRLQTGDEIYLGGKQPREGVYGPLRFGMREDKDLTQARMNSGEITQSQLYPYP